MKIAPIDLNAMSQICWWHLYHEILKSRFFATRFRIWRYQTNKRLKTVISNASPDWTVRSFLGRDDWDFMRESRSIWSYQCRLWNSPTSFLSGHLKFMEEHIDMEEHALGRHLLKTHNDKFLAIELWSLVSRLRVRTARITWSLSKLSAPRKDPVQRRLVRLNGINCIDPTDVFRFEWWPVSAYSKMNFLWGKQLVPAWGKLRVTRRRTTRASGATTLPQSQTTNVNLYILTVAYLRAPTAEQSEISRSSGATINFIKFLANVQKVNIETFA
jgi:hypothetical protein